MKRIAAMCVIGALLPNYAIAQSLDRIAEGLQHKGALKFNVEAVSLQGAPCDSSNATGRTDANTRHGSVGWFLGGVGAGVGLGLIGTGIITGASALGSPQPRQVPADVDENCYREGYRGRAKGKNVKSAFLGGLVGTGAWLAIYLANND